MIKILLFTTSLLLMAGIQTSFANPVKKGIIAKKDYQKLIQLALVQHQNKYSKNIGSKPKKNHFVSLSMNNFKKLKDEIVSLGGRIEFCDKKTGYIHFSIQPSNALELLYNDSFKTLILDKTADTKTYDNKPLSIDDNINNAILKDLSSTSLMRVDLLKKHFKSEYGKELDGSETTVAVFDTGIDLARTDVFQDRIVGLRSIRATDIALVTEADVLDAGAGEKYLHASLGGVEILIQKSKRLAKDRTYYLGLISEQLLLSPRAGYTNIDLNQDGKPTGLFPIVVYKNDAGIFEAYINVNSSMTYENRGDNSIEDENRLIDFNWVAKNVKNRYVKHDEPLKSHYKFTTRMDIVETDRLLSDRNKGLMNLAITLEPGIELTDDGKDLKKLENSPANQNLYRVGLAGFDPQGHGTHVTGIAAGKFETAPIYSSGAQNAKIVNVAMIGNATTSSIFDMIIMTMRDHKNVVFNFSFGTNVPINDTQSEEAIIFDAIARVYNIPFMKSAGNEGPGIKSHGLTISKYMISVANYMSSNACEFFGHGVFEKNKYWPDSTSSRGPLVDGALKPDIGAPGWVLSSLPLAIPLGSNSHSSFKYFPGTSMAAPNAASVVALLMDAAVKSGMTTTTQGKRGQAVSLDKIRKALISSAIPYDTFTYTHCSSKNGETFFSWCQPSKETFKFSWLEGGRGRINAIGAWNTLKEIFHNPVRYYTTKTRSKYPGYNKDGVGYFNIGNVDNIIDFQVAFDGTNKLEEFTMHERLKLTIPEDIDWLSFDRIKTVRERHIDVFGNENAKVRIFVRKEKLSQNGKLKPGLHFAAITGSNIKTPKDIDVVLPVTVIGYHTNFDSFSENHKFAAQGFTPATMFQRFFIPLKNRNGATILNLDVSPTLPGDLSMHVYANGMDIPLDALHAKKRWALSSTEYGEGRSHLQFIAKDLPKGLHEVIVKTDVISNYLFEDIPGAYFLFSAGKLGLHADDVIVKKQPSRISLVLKNIVNNGSMLRISGANVYSNTLKKDEMITVENKKQLMIPITVPESVGGINISTSYLGSEGEMDIDLILVDSTGNPIGQSGNPHSNEKIKCEITAGNYVLIVDGYNIPTETEKFGLITKMIMKQPVILTEEFEANGATLTKDFKWHSGQMFTFQTNFETSSMDTMPKIEGFTPVISTEIHAIYNNDGKTTSVFKKELN